MSSAPSHDHDPAPKDDRTTKARIRDAAISVFAECGVAETTARKVANAAGVSPGLVIHHFGSMDGLRTECDEHVTAVIRHYKQDAMAEGPNLDILAALRRPESGPLMGYLAQVLTDDSAAMAKLVDGLVNDAEGYIQQGVESGILRPSDDPRGRAVVLTIWGLGALVLHEHLDRLLGVDLTDPDVLRDPSFGAYAGPTYEIYGDGLFTPEFFEDARESFASIARPNQDEPKDPSQTEGTA
jgi:AcrR family transcriptional regulator